MVSLYYLHAFVTSIPSIAIHDEGNMLWYWTGSKHGEEGTSDAVEDLVQQPVRGCHEKHEVTGIPVSLDAWLDRRVMWRTPPSPSQSESSRPGCLRLLYTVYYLYGLLGGWGLEGVAASNDPQRASRT